MEWVFRSPQIHSTFSNLGFLHADGYHVNDGCNGALETILHNILTEDKYLRTYRRSISFGQNVKKDLIPLLIHAKDEKTTELLIRILLNLTIPIECLLSVEVISKNDFGRHTIFEINNLLVATKVAFTDHRVTRVVIEFMKKNMDFEQKSLLSVEQCRNISNSLLLMRNILHIPEDTTNQNFAYKGCTHGVQNQILWNIFSQSIDKVLIKLMTVPDASYWGVTMVQLVALLYKDQHVITLHKLLNIWLEASLSESSEDNESNTTPPDRGSENSSPMLTSDPTSDSSDTGASGKSTDELNSANGWDTSPINNISDSDPIRHFKASERDADMEEKHDTSKPMPNSSMKFDKEQSMCSSGIESESNGQGQISKSEKKNKCENSDCGYGTQIENQESISSSSNEDELPAKKPVHQKPHNPKQKINNKARSGASLQERKRKKLFKRGKSNIINVQGLSHTTPTDDDIANVLKEFTVDFLLKGYNSLVHTLHTQILTNMQLEIDTSHFFWLVTYFLKFATQIELDLKHVCSVLSFDIVSYLTAEGVNLCEQFEIAIKIGGNDLKPSIRRLHLVVTAIREFVQAIEVYNKNSQLCNEDKEVLTKLQIKMCETEELRSLLVLLLRHYNPKYHSRQYLQDLIVTNHILLMFLDNVMKLHDYSSKCSTNMHDHIKQFATPEVMYQYGLLLEDYAGNGEFVNDCIFTIMHHVGGELDSLAALFQPNILKTFTSIWKLEFEICEDWSDLIEYVINTFVKKPQILKSAANICLNVEGIDGDLMCSTPKLKAIQSKLDIDDTNGQKNSSKSNASNTSKDRWTTDELSSLSWNYLQSSSLPDVVGEIIKLFKEDGVFKSRESVIRELFKQTVINKEEFEKFMKAESDMNMKTVHVNNEIREEEITKLCENLVQDGKTEFLEWVQKILLDVCFVKMYLEKKKREGTSPKDETDLKFLNFEIFKKKSEDLPMMSPVSYHSLLRSQSVPLVPWNSAQATICKDLKFSQLLHNLGFHMPGDSGKVFIRIPHFWTAEFMYDVAGKIFTIDSTKLKFSIDDINRGNVNAPKEQNNSLDTGFSKDVTMTDAPEHFYQIQKQKHLSTMINYTPMPGSSFNSEGLEINKHNWLDVVKKSQEYKITLALDSNIVVDEDAQSDVVMELPEKEHEPVTSVLQEAASSAEAAPSSSAEAGGPLTEPSLMMTTDMSTNQDTSNNLVEAEYYNSLCETASVASDLTRMYVSDEEEKPDVPSNPDTKVVDADASLLKNTNAKESQRKQFSSPF